MVHQRYVTHLLPCQGPRESRRRCCTRYSLQPLQRELRERSAWQTCTTSQPHDVRRNTGSAGDTPAHHDQRDALVRHSACELLLELRIFFQRGSSIKQFPLHELQHMIQMTCSYSHANWGAHLRAGNITGPMHLCRGSDVAKKSLACLYHGKSLLISRRKHKMSQMRRMMKELRQLTWGVTSPA